MVGRSLAYQVVDVFTDTAFAGNPLAVVLDTDDLTTEQLQALATEFNLSETAFPHAAPEGASYGLRIFTPSVELPFAGHPSVGAAWVLHQLGRIDAGDNVQACGAGLLPITVTADGATLTGGTPACGPVLDVTRYLMAVGLTPEDHVGPAPRDAGVGIDFAYLMVRPEALAQTLPNPSVLLEEVGISVIAWDGTTARCRMFAGGSGVAEDPATGSAALGLGVYLAATGLLAEGQHDYVVQQGYEMGRPSTLTCTVEIVDGAAVRTTVTGGVVPIARGEIRVPSV